MALKKLIDIDNKGIQGSYHKIIETNINWLNRDSHVVIATYLDQQARSNGRSPLTSVGFDWSGAEFPFEIELLDEVGENVLHVAYEKIKLPILNEEGSDINIFSNSEDC